MPHETTGNSNVKSGVCVLVQVVFRKLDLASFRSVAEFAKKIKKEEKAVDILVNNAGMSSLWSL